MVINEHSLCTSAAFCDAERKPRKGQVRHNIVVDVIDAVSSILWSIRTQPSKNFLMIRANMAWTIAMVVAERNGEILVLEMVATGPEMGQGEAAKSPIESNPFYTQPCWIYAAYIVQDLAVFPASTDGMRFRILGSHPSLCSRVCCREYRKERSPPTWWVFGMQTPLAESVTVSRSWPVILGDHLMDAIAPDKSRRTMEMLTNHGGQWRC
ncbi:hypothetical protein E2P81_ATG04671 [Venturia nashicola]|nr:hypothetical protein E2P81_ATG04671 [Venturia nashicola]